MRLDTAVIIGTGPSLTKEQLSIVRELQIAGKVSVFGMNHVWNDYNDLDVFIACNIEYYEKYWEGLKEIKADKWTWHKGTAEKFGINYIEGRWQDGFSTDKNYLHLGHSSGFQLPGIAYHYGFRKMLLLGYDMSYAHDYDGKNREIGSTKRHYFGEYDSSLQHWPSIKVKDGVFTELIEQFEKVKQINTDIEIINCSPGSAMTCFPMDEISNYV